MLPYELHLGDCLASLKTMPDNSVDAIVTDPPYELGFMGKGWDKSGIANNVELWREALRVLKPGGHLLAFSGSRTYHRMTCAIEDAGFEVRDQIMWLYGSGFPKSLDVSKAIDGHITNGRSDSLALKTVNETRPGDATVRATSQNGHRGIVGSGDVGPSVKRATPATEQGAEWSGWGTALKPAHEPICVARKPLVGTVAANALEWGTGALNIDGCRIEGGEIASAGGTKRSGGIMGDSQPLGGWSPSHTGRWPANLIHDGSDEVLAGFPDSNGSGAARTLKRGKRDGEGWGMADEAGALRDAGTGSAARFFYCAKASRKDRNEGLASGDAPAVGTGATMREREDADWQSRNGNHHPTVKPTDLMAYLVRLVTPPGGTVLDPFMGSGSTGKAAMREGFRFIGCEMSEEYIAIARARIEHELAKATAASSAPVPAQPSLFDTSPAVPSVDQ